MKVSSAIERRLKNKFKTWLNEGEGRYVLDGRECGGGVICICYGRWQITHSYSPPNGQIRFSLEYAQRNRGWFQKIFGTGKIKCPSPSFLEEYTETMSLLRTTKGVRQQQAA